MVGKKTGSGEEPNYRKAKQRGARRVTYGPTQTWTILRTRLGWSRRRPARRAVERDEDAIVAWRER